MGRPNRRRAPRIEELEARILHSADLLAVLGGVPGDGGVPLSALVAHAVQPQSASRELAFVDPASDRSGALARLLQARERAGSQVERLALAPHDDLATLTRTLAARRDVGTLHLSLPVLGDALRIGRESIGMQALDRQAHQVAQWSSALAPGAQLALHAGGPWQAGAAFQVAQSIAQLAGATLIDGATLAAPAAQAAREVVFIDAGAADAQALAQRWRDAAAARGAAVEVVMLDARGDGLAQIGRWLAGAQDLRAIHIVSHGAAGQVRLGGMLLDESTLRARAAELQAWRGALADGADLLIYGCDLAANDAGVALMAGLRQATGADVAGSDDRTGAAELGGDWMLEVRLGEVQADWAAAAPSIAGWQGTLATFTVTNTNDNGAGSLRQAIQDANANGAGLDIIQFSIAGTGIHTINLGSALLVQSAVLIDATTDDSFAANGSRPAIVLNGQGLVQDGFDLYVNSSGSTIRGFVIQNFTQDGIDISGSHGNTIVGNWIGLNVAGSGAAGNQQGINLWNANNNIIGGSTAADRNVISGNTGPGVSINTNDGTSTGNQIRGNYIGTDVAGTAAVGNSNQGVYINAPGNTVGGTVNGQGNVISGTLNWSGVGLDTGASGTLVAGNLIGLNAAGTAALANAGGGISVLSANNTIGGTTAQARNVVSGNGGAGIRLAGASATGNVVIGNYVGTDHTGTADVNGLAATDGVSGIVLDGGANNNRIGTDANGINDAAERNVISGNNWFGLEFLGNGTDNNVAQGNYIGTDATGLASLGNTQGGVSFWNQAANNRLGGGASGAGNVIAANGTGVLLANAATGNKVQGNLIGLGADGNTILGNGGAGVYFYNGGSASAVSGNVIGTDADGSNDAGERNVISGNFGGVALEDAEVTGNTVAGNFIGTDATGLLDRGNAAYGVTIVAGAHANQVGGSLVVQRNVISGNDGVAIQVANEDSDDNVLRGNWIGVAADGSGAIGNGGQGILIQGGADNTLVGGTGASDGNWIASAGSVGIEVTDASVGTVIQGNRIGTDLAGTANWGMQEEGIWLHNGASGTLVGGTSGASGNVVAFNGQGGIWTPGIAVWDAASTGNVILRNSIYGNVGLGIDLGNDGVSANDADDVDIGPNHLQNTLVLSEAVVNGGTLTISASFVAAPNTYHRIDVYANTEADPSGAGEGRTWIGSVNVPVGASGSVTDSYAFASTATAGMFVTATATLTDAGYATLVETSEFSNHMQVVPQHVAPSGADATVTGTEDQVYTFTTADFGFSDADGDALMRVHIDTLPASGTLLWNGSAFAAGNWIDAGDIAAGLLTYAPTADAAGTGVASFSFRLQDDGGTLGGGSDTDASANTITIDVTAVNDAPYNNGSLPATLTMTEDALSSLNLSTIDLADVDAASSSVTLRLTTATGGQLFAGGGAGITLATGAFNHTVTITGTLADLNAYLNAPGNILYRHGTTHTSGSGADTVTVTINDNGHTGLGGGAEVGLGVVSIDITPVDDAPVFSGLDGTPSFVEGGAAVVLDADVTVADPELDATGSYAGATLYLQRAGLNSSYDVFVATGTLGALTEGGSLIVGGVTIGSVDLNSSGMLRLNFDANATTAWVNQAMQQIAYSNTNGAPAASVDIDWTFSDGNTGAQGSGGALSATGQTVVAIQAVNDAPLLFGLDGAPTFVENGAPVVLDGNVSLFDYELGSADRFTGATLTLQRQGGADAADLFVATGTLGALAEGGALVVGGTTIGTVTQNSAGVLRLTFNASASNLRVDQAARMIGYAYGGDAPPASVQIDWTLDDGNTGMQGSGGALSATGSATVSITAVDDAPAVAVPAAQTTAEDTSLVFSAALGNAITIDDDGSAGAPVELTLSVTQGTLTLAGSAGLSFVNGDGSADAGMTLRGSVADINAALDGLSYAPGADFHGGATLTVSVLDAQLLSLNLDAGLKGWYTFTSGGGDSGPGATQGATLSNGAAVVGDATRGPVLQLDGIDDHADLSSHVADFAGLTAGSISGWIRTTGTFQTVFSVSDTADPGSYAALFLGASGYLTYEVMEDGVMQLAVYRSSAAINDGNWHHVAVTVGPAGNQLYVDGQLAEPGQLTYDAGHAGTQSFLGNVSGVDAMAIGRNQDSGGGKWATAGSLDDVRIHDRVLDPAEIAALAADLALRDTATVAVTVQPVNDAPSFTQLDGTPTFVEDGPPVVLDVDLALIDLELAAASFDGATLQLARQGGAHAQDSFVATGALAALTPGGALVVGGQTIGTVVANGGGVLQLSFDANATAARVNAALQQIGYANSADVPPASVQIEWTFDDGNAGAQGSGGALGCAGSVTVNIVATNDAPTVITTPGSLSYNENAPATAVDPGLLLSNADGAQLSGATVRVSVGYVQGQDSLAVASPGSMGWSWDDVSGTLTLAGAASVADYQSALRSVTYVNASEAPSSVVRTVAFSVDDGSDGSAAATRQIQVVSIEDAPTTNDTSASAAEDSPSVPITLTGSDVDNTISHFRITSLPPLGALYLDAGLTTLLAQGVDYAATAQALTVYYAPPADWHGSTSFQFAARDAAGLADTTQATATIDIAPVDDVPGGVPTISGTATEDQTLTADTSAITDADGLGAFSVQWLRDGVDIAGANGLAYTLGDGDVGTQISVRVDYVDGQGHAETLTSAIVGPVANLNDAPSGQPTINGTPTEDQTLTVDTSAIADADGPGVFSMQWLRNGVAITGANAASYTLGDADVGMQIGVRVDYTDGEGAAETLTSAAVGPIANVNDVPVQLLPAVDQVAVEDTGFVYTLPAGMFADIDTGDRLSLRVDGLPAWLSFDAATGQLSGTPANADVGSVTLRWVATDQAGATASADFALQVLNANDAPQLLAAGPLVLDEGGRLAVGPGVLQAVDPDPGAAPSAWRLAVAPTAGTLRLNGVALQAGDAFTQADVDADRLDYVHAGDEQFVDGIELVLGDGVAAPATVRLAVQVRPVNDQAPVIGGPDAHALQENTGLVATLVATDADLPAATLTWQLAGGADAARFTMDAGTGALRFVAAPDFEQPADADGNNLYELTVQVSDGALSQHRAIQVRVGDDDEPMVVQGGDLAGTEDTAVTGDAALQVADPEHGSLSFTLALAPAHGQVSIDAQGRFSYLPGSDWSGSDSFALQVSDGLHSTTLPMTVRVQAVDDTPSLALASLSAVPGGTITLSMDQLQLRDVDTPLDQLRVDVADVRAAQFEHRAAPGVAIVSFTTQQVAQGDIVLRLDGGSSPTFALRAADGSSASAWVQGQVSVAPVVDVADPGVVDTPGGTLFDPGKAQPDPVGADVAAAVPPQQGPAADNAPEGAADRGATQVPSRAPAAGNGVASADDRAGANAVFENPAASDNRLVGSMASRAAFSARPLAVQRVALGWPGSINAALPDFQAWFDALTGMVVAQGGSGMAPNASGRNAPESEGPAQFQAELGSLELGGLAAAVLLVSWAVRAGGIVGSLAITSPAWRMVDPLPIIGDGRADESDPDADDDPPDEAMAAEVLVGGAAR